METKIRVNWLRYNGLLPDGAKPLPEPMVTIHQWDPLTSDQWSHEGNFTQEIPQPPITRIRLDITLIKFAQFINIAPAIRSTDCLTYRGRGKMASISQTTFPNAVNPIKHFNSLWLNWQHFSMVLIMALCQKGDEPVSEAMMTTFTDTYVRCSAPLS